MEKSAPVIYQLKIKLQGITPQIYRKVLVKSDITLNKLERILFGVLDWEGGHLSQFDIFGEFYGGEYVEDVKPLTVKLNIFIKTVKQKFTWEYDFGDSWVHEITLEKILPIEDGKTYPICIAGARCCPPEDCGGVWGYADIIKELKKPEEDRDEDLMEWVGDDYDPEYFDIEEINKYLNNIK